MTTRTVGELTDDLRKRADARGMEVRHPDADLYQLLTQSLRSVRSMVTRSGGDFFLEGTAPAALPTSPPTPTETFLEVAWPLTAVSIHGLDVLLGQNWYPLDPVSFLSRRDYQCVTGAPPRAFVTRTIPKETPGASLTAGVIQIYPLNTQGYSYRIWYLPELPTLSNPAHVVQGFDGDWIEWALWDSTIKICAEDDDVQAVDQIATRERAIVQERIVASLQRVQSAGVITPKRARAYR
jgi:hypothetical protein